jgi:hypothetical protein
MTSEKVTWHYGREQNGVVNTMTEAELEPLFFTFVVSTFCHQLMYTWYKVLPLGFKHTSFFTFVVSAAATSTSTRVLRLVAKVLTTKVKNKGLSFILVVVFTTPFHSLP